MEKINMKKVNQLGLAVLATITFSSSALALDAQCASTDEAAVASLFDRWNNSLKTLDSDKVVANYADDAVLLPTVSNKPRTNHEEIKDYFNSFLKKEPSGVIDKRIIKIGCNVAQDVGVYTFTFKGGQKVQARYTYVYEYENGNWLIAHHHSSVMPEKVATAKKTSHHHPKAH